ncbi:hypothetical protein N184_32930 [Sinorhizobium sp. GL28]|nr:hypothetical protein N183_03965 [Sinorhizobium sp. Sb3]KSV85619.1 hypothetical protein N184_32930 [Sinorhizobium sp. GL28]
MLSSFSVFFEREANAVAREWFRRISDFFRPVNFS